MPTTISLIALPKVVKAAIACVLMNITIFEGCQPDMQQLATSLINTTASGLIEAISQLLNGLIQVAVDGATV